MVSITRYTTPQTPEPITKRPVVADVSPMKDSDSDDNILHTIKQEKMVIDLCTPEKQVQKAGAAINKKPIKTESVIDLCSPVKLMLVSQGVKPESPPAKIVKASCSAIDTFSVYQSIDEAEAAIYAREEALGYQWKRAQVEKDSYGQLKKRTFLCNCYYT